MWSFKRDILKTNNEVLSCISVTFSTNFDAYTIEYFNCDGNYNTISIGGQGGYEQETVCLSSIISSGGATVTYNGLCVQ
jgi:hypothetical protein